MLLVAFELQEHARMWYRSRLKIAISLAQAIQHEGFQHERIPLESRSYSLGFGSGFEKFGGAARKSQLEARFLDANLLIPMAFTSAA